MVKTVWEYLGISAPRPDHKTVQKVQNRSAASKRLGKISEIAQVKKDGVYCLTCSFDEEQRFFSRTNKEFTNIPQIVKGIVYHGTGMYMYITELCCDTLSLEELSGAVNPLRVNPYDWKEHKLYFVFHDALTIEEFIAGYSPVTYLHRLDKLKDVYFSKTIQLIENLPLWIDFDNAASYYIDELGEEGVVYKDIRGDWKAGRKNYHMTKVVKGVDFDLRIVAIELGKAGTKRAGSVTNFICDWNLYGKPDGTRMTIPVDLGKGWTDGERLKVYLNPSDYIGKIVHVHGLAVGSKGKIRLPKAMEIRADKTMSDMEETIFNLLSADQLNYKSLVNAGISPGVAQIMIELEEKDEKE